MPKLKTRKAAAKRYKISGSGKVLRRKANISHLQECKSPKNKTSNKGYTAVDKTDAMKINHMLPYKNK
jgi:large subunit ribosomal protein L35